MACIMFLRIAHTTTQTLVQSRLYGVRHSMWNIESENIHHETDRYTLTITHYFDSPLTKATTKLQYIRSRRENEHYPDECRGSCLDIIKTKSQIPNPIRCCAQCMTSVFSMKKNSITETPRPAPASRTWLCIVDALPNSTVILSDAPSYPPR